MAMLKKTFTIEIEYLPKELATLFWAMNEDEQAKFFSELGKIVSYDGGLFENQMQCVMTNDNLEEGGRYIMYTIGEYSGKHD